MSKPQASDIKMFVPSKDFTLSRDFYVALGWKLNWEQNGLAELELTDCRMISRILHVVHSSG